MHTPAPQVIVTVNLDIFKVERQALAMPSLSLSWGLGLEALGTLDGTKSPWGSRPCSRKRCPSFEELTWVLAGKAGGDLVGGFHHWDELIVLWPDPHECLPTRLFREDFLS